MNTIVQSSGGDAVRIISLDEMILRLKPALEALDIFISEEIGDFEIQIQDLIKECLSNSGKRLRPLLVFTSGYKGGSWELISKDLLRLGTIIEFVHIATLIHDDILDNASIRHKKPTIASLYGNTVAVLLGDALFAHAMKLAADFPTVEVCHYVSLATRKVCVGEIEQTLNRGKFNVSLDEYLRVIEYKTAGLFEVGCYLGGLVGGYEEKYAVAARTFGNKLGIAYQILDDLLDIWGKTETIGKTLGTDLASGKMTLPFIFLHESVSREEFNELTVMIQNQDIKTTEYYLEKMEKYNIQEKCIKYFNEVLIEAENSIKEFKGYVSVEYLMGMMKGIKEMLKKNLVC